MGTLTLVDGESTSPQTVPLTGTGTEMTFSGTGCFLRNGGRRYERHQDDTVTNNGIGVKITAALPPPETSPRPIIAPPAWSGEKVHHDRGLYALDHGHSLRNAHPFRQRRCRAASAQSHRQWDLVSLTPSTSTSALRRGTTVTSSLRRHQHRQQHRHHYLPVGNRDGAAPRKPLSNRHSGFLAAKHDLRRQPRAGSELHVHDCFQSGYWGSLSGQLYVYDNQADSPPEHHDLGNRNRPAVQPRPV